MLRNLPGNSSKVNAWCWLGVEGTDKEFLELVSTWLTAPGDAETGLFFMMSQWVHFEVHSLMGFNWLRRFEMNEPDSSVSTWTSSWGCWSWCSCIKLCPLEFLLIFLLFGDSGPFIRTAAWSGSTGISDGIAPSGIRTGIWATVTVGEEVAKLPSQLTVLWRCNRFICGNDRTDPRCRSSNPPVSSSLGSALLSLTSGLDALLSSRKTRNEIKIKARKITKSLTNKMTSNHWTFYRRLKINQVGRDVTWWPLKSTPRQGLN